MGLSEVDTVIVLFAFKRRCTSLIPFSSQPQSTPFVCVVVPNLEVVCASGVLLPPHLCVLHATSSTSLCLAET